MLNPDPNPNITTSSETASLYSNENSNSAVAIIEAEMAKQSNISHLLPKGLTSVGVIPAYNEDRFIGSVVLKSQPYVDFVIVVDDGSSDQTAAVASEAGAEVIICATNNGKARALEIGFARALELGADIVVILDGDGQHNPDEIPSIMQPILSSQVDLVIGSRFQDVKNGIPVWRQVGQHVLTFITNISSRTSISDSQSGFRAIRGDALKTFTIHGKGFAIESEMQFWIKQQNLQVFEVPISCVYAEGPKRNPFQQGMQVLSGIIDLVSRSRPLFFFSLLGIMSLVLGTGLWWWIVRIFHQTGEYAFGYSLIGTLLIILGVLSVYQGITLHIMRQMMNLLVNPPKKKHRRVSTAAR